MSDIRFNYKNIIIQLSMDETFLNQFSALECLQSIHLKTERNKYLTYRTMKICIIFCISKGKIILDQE